jgi:hypothetical protein
MPFGSASADPALTNAQKTMAEKPHTSKDFMLSILPRDKASLDLRWKIKRLAGR